MDRRHQKQAARFNDLAVVRGHIVIKTLAFAALPAKLAADAGCHLAIAQLDRLSFNSGLFCSGTKMPDNNIRVPPLARAGTYSQYLRFYFALFYHKCHAGPS